LTRQNRFRFEERAETQRLRQVPVPVPGWQSARRFPLEAASPAADKVLAPGFPLPRPPSRRRHGAPRNTRRRPVRPSAGSPLAAGRDGGIRVRCVCAASPHQCRPGAGSVSGQAACWQEGTATTSRRKET